MNIKKTIQDNNRKHKGVPLQRQHSQHQPDQTSI